MALGTAMDILALFERPEVVRLSLLEVATATGLGKSTVSGVLAELADAGYLSRSGSGGGLRYAMGNRFQEAFVNAIARQVARLEEARREFNGEALIAMEPMRRLLEAVGRPEGGSGKGEVGSGTGERQAPECGAMGGGA